jgi:hypothetical protein
MKNILFRRPDGIYEQSSHSLFFSSPALWWRIVVATVIMPHADATTILLMLAKHVVVLMYAYYTQTHTNTWICVQMIDRPAVHGWIWMKMKCMWRSENREDGKTFSFLGRMPCATISNRYTYTNKYCEQFQPYLNNWKQYTCENVFGFCIKCDRYSNKMLHVICAKYFPTFYCEWLSAQGKCVTYLRYC